MINKILLFVFIILGTGSRQVLSQDVIVKFNNDSIHCKIVNITPDKIKYKFNHDDQNILEIHKNQVKQIVYENGSKLNIIYNRFEVSSDMLVPDRFHAVKVDLFAPLLNHITVGYEMKIIPRRSIEIKGGYIGPYISKSLYYSEGYFAKAGIKFIKTGINYSKGLKYVQPLKGSYLKPELIFGQFKRVQNNFDIHFTYYAAEFQFGKQYVFGNRTLIDIFGALGYAFQTSKYTIKHPSKPDKMKDDFSYSYSYLYFGNKLPLLISGGVLIGIVY